MEENVLNSDEITQNNNENELNLAHNYVDERYYWLKTAENRPKSAEKVNKIRVLSLFSGIGSPEKALQNISIDYELVGFSEIDKYAAKSYSAIHGVDESLNLGDITKIDEQTLPKDIDLMTYGFPCQDISVAGKQAGFKDENGNKTRSGLFFDALRIIKYVQPKVAIAENVKNLTGKKFKNEFEIVLNSLDEAGYNCYWKVLNAKNFGVPQNRERVFIVSIRKDIDNGLFQFPDETQIDLRLKDVLESDVDEKYYLSEKAMSKIKFLDIDYERTDRILVEASLNPEKKVQDRARVLSSQGLCQTIRSTDYKDPAKILQVAQIYPNSGNPQAGRIYDVDGISPSIDTCSGGNRMPKVINGDIKPRLIGGIGEQNFGKQYRQGNRIYDSDAIAMALTSSPVGNNGGNSYLYKVTSAAMRARNNDVGDYEQVVEISDREISNSITTVQKDSLVCESESEYQCRSCAIRNREDGARLEIRKDYVSNALHGNIAKSMVLYTNEYMILFWIRRLTPKECWRLMGFTDEDFEKAEKVNSNTQLYKQAGNSIVVQVMEAIYKQLQIINKL